MKFFTVLFAALFAFSTLGVSAPINDDHFNGGQNLNKGSRRGADKHLGELISDIQEDVETLQDAEAEDVEATFTATFTGLVGAKTVVVRKSGRSVVLEIPSGTTADPGAATIASGATDLPAAYRPAATLTFPVVVSNNGAKAYGTLTITAAGQLTFGVAAAGGAFTDDAAAGFDRVAVGYTLAAL